MAQVFADTVKMDFKIIALFDPYINDTFSVSRDNWAITRQEMLEEVIVLSAIEQDEYSSAFLPSWTEPIFEADFNDKRNVKIFLHYCDLVLNGKILFGVQTKNIASIELELS